MSAKKPNLPSGPNGGEVCQGGSGGPKPDGDGEGVPSRLAASQAEVGRLHERVAALERELEQVRAKATVPDVWRTAFESAPYGMAIHRMRDGVYLAANPAFLRNSGYEAAEVLGRPHWELQTPEQREDSRAVSEALARHGAVRELEIGYTARDGSPKRVVFSATVYHSEGEDYCLSLTVDVSEARQAQDALRESEERFRRLFEDSAEAILLIENEAFIDCNRAAMTMLGMTSREQVCGLPPARLSPPQQPDGQPSDTKARAMIAQAHQLGSHMFEWVHLRADGQPFTAEVLLTPMRHRQRQLLHVVWRDITERKRMEESLRLQTRRLAFAFSATSDAIWEWNPATNRTYFSPRWYEMLGYQDQQWPMTLAAWESLCHPDDLRPTLAAVEDAVKDPSGKGFQVEYRLRSAQGAWIWISSRGNVVERDDAGRPLTVCGTNADITPRKQMEEVSRRRQQLLEQQNQAVLSVMLDGGLFREDFRHSARRLTEVCAQMLQTERVSVWLHEDDGATLRCVDLYERSRGTHSQGMVFKSADFPDCSSRDRRVTAVAIEDVDADPLTRHIPPAHFRQHDVRSLLAAPIWVEGRMGGALSFEQVGAKRAWTVEDERLAASMATLASLGIEIEQRRRAQAALARRERQLSDIAANFPGVIFQFRVRPDGQADFPFLSERAAHMIGAEASPRNAYARLCERIHPEDLPRFFASVREATERVAPWCFEGRFIDPSGAVKWFSARSLPQKHGDDLLFNGVTMDVTDRKLAEEALRESEARLQSIIEELPFSMMVLSPQGEVLQMNQACLGLWKVPPARVERYNLLQDPQLAAIGLAPAVQRAFAGERVSLPIVTYDPVTVFGAGERRVVQGELYPIRKQTGEVQRVVLVHLDLTDRLRAEEELRRSESTLRSLYRAVPVGLVIVRDRKFLSVNVRFAEFTGYSVEDLLHHSSRLLYESEQEFERVWQDLSNRLWEQGSNYVETRFRCANGSLRDVFLYGAPLDPKDREAGVAIAIKDITDQKRDEDRLRQQAALLNATHDALIVWGPRKGVRYINAAAESLTGLRATQAEGKELKEVLRTRSDDELHAAVQAVNATGEWSGELTLLTAPQKEVPVDSRWTGVPHPEGAEPLLLIRCTDITEKKRLEANYLRAQRLESVGTLASGVAHDLNNILSPIVMGLDMLKTAITTADDKAMLAMMEDSARRGADTVRQLLTFARGADTQRGPVQPRHLLKEVTRLLQQTFPKDIQVYTDFAGEPRTVLADPSQLHQVLMNLCVNARDAMPEGGVLFLTVANTHFDENQARLHPKARAGDYVVIKVADSGTGIPPEVMDRIFDPFFTTKPQGKGTGLGLATVLGIVESHGGFVLVESQPKKGAVFQVFLPAGLQTEGGVTRTERRAAPRGRGELILIVDDEPAILHLAAEIARRGGYTPLTAKSASEVVHVYERNYDRIRAVLTDIMMPFGDGRQLITMLYEQHPGLPIVAMSGVATKEFQDETFKRGATAFLAKPFTGEQLLSTLAAALQHHPA